MVWFVVVVSVVVVVSSEVLSSVELVYSVLVLSLLDVESVVSVVLVSPVVEVVLSLDVESEDDEVVASVEVSAGAVKANGAEWVLSVPSLKVAVRVKLVVSAVSVTWQSMEVAAGTLFRQAKVPSW